jgi:hypothetical protein
MDRVGAASVDTSLVANSGLPNLQRFGTIMRECGLSSSFYEAEKTTIPSRLLRDLLRLALEQVNVDESHYLRLYPDVTIALESGQFCSPHHHFVEFGYFEDRLPFRIEDEEFYFRQNPDIKESVDAGIIPSAQVHFEQHGYKEGRLPWLGWSLLACR